MRHLADKVHTRDGGATPGKILDGGATPGKILGRGKVVDGEVRLSGGLAFR